MYSSESESEVLPEDDEEGKLYQLIYELTIDDKEPNAELQIPSSGRKSSVQVDVSPKGTVENGTVPLAEGHKSRVNDRTTGRHLHASVITGVSDQAAAERPWRAPGAVISDYFNYGFNEDSWRLYRKHGRFCAASGSPPCSGPVQEGRSAPEDAAPRPAPPGGPPRPRASRRPIDRHGTGGRAGRRGTVRGSRTLEDEGNDSQVYMSPDEDGFTFLHPSPPLDFSPVFAVVPPPPFLQPSSNRSSPYDSGHSKGPEDPSVHQRSGASSLPPRSPASGPVWYRARERPRANGRCERDEGNCSSSHRQPTRIQAECEDERDITGAPA
ncbi:uncharacterized protein fip1l1a isoform 6-T6 [Spinachia spinachia]